jgi:hypothetical protein
LENLSTESDKLQVPRRSQTAREGTGVAIAIAIEQQSGWFLFRLDQKLYLWTESE